MLLLSKLVVELFEVIQFCFARTELMCVCTFLEFCYRGTMLSAK